MVEFPALIGGYYSGFVLSLSANLVSLKINKIKNIWANYFVKYSFTFLCYNQAKSQDTLWEFGFTRIHPTETFYNQASIWFLNGPF